MCFVSPPFRAFALALALCLGARAAAPKLVVKELVHDFGVVQQGTPLEAKLDFSNGGDAVLHITEVSPSCGCTTTGAWPHELKPGEATSIPVKVETSHFNGPIAKTVTVGTDDPDQPTVYFEFRAKVSTPISIASSVLIFPAASDPAQTYSRSTTVRGETGEPLKLTAPVSDNAAFEPKLKTVIPDKEYDLVVTTRAPLAEGTQSARITMQSSLSTMPRVTVEAVITLLPAVQVAPMQIALGPNALATSEKRFAAVVSHRASNLVVSDLVTDAPGAKVSSEPSPDHKQVTISIVFPAGFALRSGQTYTLRGKTNVSAMPTFEIPIVSTAGR